MKMKRLTEREWDSPNPTRLSDLMVLCSVHATGGRVKVTVFKAGGGKEGKKLSHAFILFKQFLSTGLLQGLPPQLIGVVKCRKKTPGLII